MDKNYERHILEVLAEAGTVGISVKNLSKHVFNMSSTLFEQPDMDEVRRNVRQFLLRNSKDGASPIEHMERWGYYRLNPNRSNMDQQLKLIFCDEEQPEEPKPQEWQDLSLSLFD